MAAPSHSSISAVTTTTAVVSNLKLSLLRPHFCPARHTFRPIKPFLNHVSVNVNNQRQLLLPARVLTVDVSSPIIQDAGATILVVAGAYALVSGFDNLTQRQIIEQVRLCFFLYV